MSDPAVTRFHVREGTTVDLNYQLLNNGAAYDLTGMTPALQLVDKRGQAVSPGTVSLVTASEGKIKIAPDGTTWRKADSPYRGAFKVTDGSSKVEFWPNGDAVLEWVIVDP